MYIYSLQSEIDSDDVRVTQRVDIDVTNTSQFDKIIDVMLQEWVTPFLQYQINLAKPALFTVVHDTKTPNMPQAFETSLIGRIDTPVVTQLGFRVTITHETSTNRVAYVQSSTYYATSLADPNVRRRIVDSYSNGVTEPVGSRVTLTIEPVYLEVLTDDLLTDNLERPVTVKKPPIVAICGKTAAGKSFLERQLIDAGFTKIRTWTTRAPRSGETESDYVFVDEEAFFKALRNRELLEEIRSGKDIEGNLVYYGTPAKLPLCGNPQKGYVTVVDPNGYNALISAFPNRVELMLLDTPTGLRRHRALRRGDTIAQFTNRNNSDNEQFEFFTARFNTLKETQS